MTLTHKWCYLGDLALGPGGASHHRVELCLEHGVVRVNFESGWYYMYPECSRWLKTTKGIEDTFLGDAWEAFREKRHSSPKPALGRGLKELMQQVSGSGALRLLEGGKAKPDA